MTGEAVYSFCLLLVFTGGRNVNQIFWAVRKSLQWVANGTRLVRGGCSGVLPAVGILSNKLSGEHFLFALTSIYISHNNMKTLEPLSIGIVKIENILRFFQKNYVKSVSLPIIRRDYFSMSDRANIRQPGIPATELRSIEREGVIYENDSRRCQDTI